MDNIINGILEIEKEAKKLVKGTKEAKEHFDAELSERILKREAEIASAAEKEAEKIKTEAFKNADKLIAEAEAETARKLVSLKEKSADLIKEWDKKLLEQLLEMNME